MRNVLKKPGKEQVECQSPKPILLDTGEMKEPYDWAVGCNFCGHTSLDKDVALYENSVMVGSYSISLKPLKTLCSFVVHLLY